MIRLYVIGVVILVVAILANGIAMKLGLKTWYEFITLIGDNGMGSLKSLHILDYLWLFIAYPLCLGVAYWLGDQLYKLF